MAGSANARLRYFLLGLSKMMFAVAGLSFLFGDRAFIAFGKMDFILAEFLELDLPRYASEPEPSHAIRPRISNGKRPTKRQ
jgi:hypothetical protein